MCVKGEPRLCYSGSHNVTNYKRWCLQPASLHPMHPGVSLQKIFFPWAALRPQVKAVTCARQAAAPGSTPPRRHFPSWVEVCLLSSSSRSSVDSTLTTSSPRRLASWVHYCCALIPASSVAAYHLERCGTSGANFHAYASVFLIIRKKTFMQ
ncbi:hypothetical protein E2C01_088744 [Portunus trituberculatus]|uniref:Uncharacterized protein n=1 Tax=Portunus trituberculatus TaxID=210409 RepID=A0A5B7JA51_PORTR|nr:hypothetical protein [Portunus trituberculatus]